MRHFKKFTIILTISLEVVLVVYYFTVLVPNYNNILFQTPNLVAGETPTCKLFITQNEAQQFYDRYKNTIKNAGSLDNDHDGRACEDLLP